ncbi:hypothetical protein [Haloferula sp. BvORR071]|uniref:hypothetical protein n=1 Tax=Haloferula sp. BvORR071 TaxID=1396141 RepID=UPI0005593CC5|nr:hypothetical protein [Haloferula sp. BvORR071]
MKAALASLSLLTTLASAQSGTDSSDWEFTLALYAPMMGLDGNIGVAGLPTANVDMSFSDVFDQLDAGLSGAFEARKGPWSITADAIWMKVSASAPGGIGQSYLRLGEDQVTASLSLGFEFYGSETSSLDLVGGVALSSIDADLDLITPNLPVKIRSASGSQEWLDPFIGLRYRQQLGDCWTIFASGNYGSFDVSSEEYWQAVAGVSYRLNDCTSLALAYRAISVDYHQSGFVYDVVSSGPNLGLVFNF